MSINSKLLCSKTYENYSNLPNLNYNLFYSCFSVDNKNCMQTFCQGFVFVEHVSEVSVVHENNCEAV